MLPGVAMARAKPPAVVPATPQRLAGCYKIKDEMAAGSQILPYSTEGQLEISYCQQMVHRIEVGGDQIDRARQAQAADVLLQEANIGVRAIACGHRQHLRRSVHTKDRDTPALAQVAGKESGATADIGSRMKLYIVPPDEPFEGRACSNEVRYTKGDVICCRQLTVRPGEIALSCYEFHGHGWYDSELQITCLAGQEGSSEIFWSTPERSSREIHSDSSTFSY